MTSSRIYIASAFGERTRAESYAVRLSALGHEIVSRWHAPNTKVKDELLITDRERAKLLRANIADLGRADLVLVIGYAGTPRATWGEAAFAIALGKPVLFVTRGARGRCLWDSHPKALRVDVGDMVVARELTAFDARIAEARML